MKRAMTREGVATVERADKGAAASSPGRWRSLDVLRGVAILLVLCSHHRFVPWLRHVGWIGVDMFLVLSGFLIAGLLFREYRQCAAIRVGRFAIRRFLRVHVPFYIFVAGSIVLLSLVNRVFAVGKPIDGREILVELLCIQNYARGLWQHTWVIGLETQFYVFIALLVWAWSKCGALRRGSGPVVLTFAAIAICCLGFRCLNAMQCNFRVWTHHYPTHLRLDAPMFGVLLAYLPRLALGRENQPGLSQSS